MSHPSHHTGHPCDTYGPIPRLQDTIVIYKCVEHPFLSLIHTPQPPVNFRMKGPELGKENSQLVLKKIKLYDVQVGYTNVWQDDC